MYADILNSIKSAITLTGQRLGDIHKIFTFLKFTTDIVSRLSHLLTLASRNNLNWLEGIEICFRVTGGNFVGGLSEEGGRRCWIKKAAEEVEAVQSLAPALAFEVVSGIPFAFLNVFGEIIGRGNSLHEQPVVFVGELWEAHEAWPLWHNLW